MSLELTLFITTNEWGKNIRKTVGLVHVGHIGRCGLYDMTMANRPERLNIRLYPEPIYSVQRETACRVSGTFEEMGILSSLSKKLENEEVTTDSFGHLRTLSVNQVVKSVQVAGLPDGKEEFIVSALKLYNKRYPGCRVVPYWS